MEMNGLRKIAGLFGAVAVAALAISCGGGGGTAAVSSRRFGSLAFSLTTTKRSYAVGEQVQGTFTVRNVGHQTINLGVSGCDFAYNVLAGGNTVGGVGGCGSQDFFNVSIAPGATEVHNFVWNQKDSENAQVPAGQYAILAWQPVVGIDGTLISPEQARSDLAASPVQVTLGP